MPLWVFRFENWNEWVVPAKKVATASRRGRGSEQEYSGYANRIKPSEGVAHDLHAKALVLQDKTGKRAVIVTTDLIGLPRWLVEPIAASIMEKTGLTREQLLFTWSHTHAGPSQSLSMIPGPGVAVADARNRVIYTKWLQERLIEEFEGERPNPCSRNAHPNAWIATPSFLGLP